MGSIFYEIEAKICDCRQNKIVVDFVFGAFGARDDCLYDVHKREGVWKEQDDGTVIENLSPTSWDNNVHMGWRMGCGR